MNHKKFVNNETYIKKLMNKKMEFYKLKYAIKIMLMME